MKKKKTLALLLVFTMLFSMLLAACAKDETSTEDTEAEVTAEATEEDAAAEAVEETTTEQTIPEDGNYVKLAIMVYYNDSDAGYFSNEVGESAIITQDGQYSLTFDCDKDLSADATGKGVISLNNLTAIYLKDLGYDEGSQSPLQAANITYDSIVVDGTELTINNPGPKSAFKASGVLDTNDPINSWDGSVVDEIVAEDHVANFTVADKPKTITITFTLSDMSWTAVEEEAVAEGTNTYVNPAVFSDMDFTNMTALELTPYLGNGINLGNTFEATAGSKNLDVSVYETAWGQPVTTKEMIAGMKNCGFDTIRIPVAWTSTMDFENGDYEINEDFMSRVQEVVDWAIENEMFVVLNDHWDYGWWAMFGSENPATVETAWNVYTKMWEQIATRFADYSDMLIFESANEELGNGLNDNGNWPDSGHLTDDEKYQLTHDINQKFVDIVRTSGGNNDDRFLLIAGFNTDFERTSDDRYKMPTDTADGKLFLSVHYYTPANYCLAGDGGHESKWGIKSDYEDMDYFMSMLPKFTDEGYGVIIGEYGALPVYVDGGVKVQNNTVEFTEYFLDWCDILNVCPVLWTTNSTYNKQTRDMIIPELTEMYTSRCYFEEMANSSYMDELRERMQNAYENADDMWEGITTYEPGTPMAWIMWNGGAGTYSVGDVYNPSDCTPGIIPHDVLVDGAGTYTVSLEFEGGNTGLTFAALAIADAELLYPGCIIDIKEITYDGEPVKMTAMAYTSSDDGKCSRVNLFNEWVSKVPDDARNKSGMLNYAAPCILDRTQINDVHELSITFDLIVP